MGLIIMSLFIVTETRTLNTINDTETSIIGVYTSGTEAMVQMEKAAEYTADTWNQGCSEPRLFPTEDETTEFRIVLEGDEAFYLFQIHEEKVTE